MPGHQLKMEYSHSIEQSGMGETRLAASIATYLASPDRENDSEDCCNIEVPNAHLIFSERKSEKYPLNYVTN
jgi:hypothetical protein